jgi:hypothetical protein
VILAAVATAALSAACSDEEPLMQPPSDLTGVVTSVTVRPARILPNGAVQIKTAIANFDPEPLVINFNTMEHYGFVIETPDTVISSPCDPDSGMSQLTIGPDAGRIVLSIFAGDRPWGFCPPPPEVLPIGKYTVRVGLLGHEDEYPWGQASFEVINEARNE